MASALHRYSHLALVAAIRNDTPAVVPETVRNTTTAVGLWLAKNAPVYVDGRGVICGPHASSDGSER